MTSTPDILRCPVCSGSLDRTPVRLCGTCETPFHGECGDYIGGCPRFACKEAANPRRRVAELLSLLVTERIWHHAGRTVGYPLLGVVLYPLIPVFLLLAICHFAMMCDQVVRRFRLNRPMSLESLVSELRYVLPGHPEVLEVPRRPPERPALIRFCVHWSLGTAGVTSLILVILPLTVRLIEPIRVDVAIAVLMASQFVVLYALFFRYIPSWLEWKRQRSLHEAQRLFRHWREEMRVFMREGPQATRLLEKAKKGLAGSAD